MKNTNPASNRLSRSLLAGACALLMASTTLAQFDGNGPNAALTVNGAVPSSVSSQHDVSLAPGYPAVLGFSSGANDQAGIILLASPFGANPAVYQTPWGGTIDLGSSVPGPLTGVSVVADGVAHTANALLDPLFRTTGGTFDFPLATAAAASGSSVALQAVVQDPTAGPLFLDNTEAADLHFESVVDTVYTLPDDNFVSHQLAIPVSFGGQLWSSFFIGSNGFVSFNHGVRFWQEDATSVFVDYEGVAVLSTDLNRGGRNSGATYHVIEDAATGIVEVRFENMIHYETNAPAGTFSVKFGSAGPGSVEVDLTGAIPQVGGTERCTTGVTKGYRNGAGQEVNLSNGMGTGILNAIGSYVSTNPPESIAEVFQSGVAFPPVPFTFANPSGEAFDWVIQ